MASHASTRTADSFEFAGRAGHALMSIPIGPLKDLIPIYRKAWREAGHPGDGEVMIAFHMFCHEDAKLAREIPRLQFEDYFVALFESAGEWTQGTSSKDYKGYDVSISRMKNSTLETQIETGAAWVGTPDEIKTIIRRLEGYVSAGLDKFVLWPMAEPGAWAAQNELIGREIAAHFIDAAKAA